MIKVCLSLLALAAAAVLAAEAGSCPQYKVSVFHDTSYSARGLQHVVDAYRAALGGDDNANNPGPLRHGHRSINWDAGVVPFDMPGNFFDKVVTRGAFFKSRGNKFAVSNPANPPPQDDRFSSLLPQVVSNQFKRFSEARLFTPVLNNKVTTQFKVPATNIRASVTGFGAVFTDVDLRRKTFLSYFDRQGCLIAKVFVTPRNKGLSFTGIIVRDPHDFHKQLPVIYKVVAKLGTASVKDFAHYKGHPIGDVVVMDDLIYGEPQKTH